METSPAQMSEHLPLVGGPMKRYWTLRIRLLDASLRIHLQRLLTLSIIPWLLACAVPSFRIAEIDQTNWTVRTPTKIASAEVITAKTLPLQPYGGMLFVSDWGEPDWEGTRIRTAAFIEQVQALRFFDQVLDSRALAKLIAAKGLGDKVLNTYEPLSLNRLYLANRPFLWVHFKSGGSGLQPNVQLVVTNPAPP
jgi:hypothetical protein